jgi:hypothetical protein
MGLSAEDFAAIQSQTQSSKGAAKPAAAPARPAAGLTTEQLTDIRLQALPVTEEPTVAPRVSMAEQTGQVSPEEVSQTLKEGFQIGLGRGAATAASGYAGLRGGLMAPVPLRAKPYAGLLGFGIGTLGGIQAAEEVEALFPEVKKQGLLPFREGAKVTGEMLMYSPFMLGMPVMQYGRVSNFLTDIGMSARKNPVQFLLGEGISAAGAGTGAYFAETAFPGNSFARFTGEVGGSIFAPGKVVMTLGNALVDYGVKLKNTIRPSESAAQQAFARKELEVANKLRGILEQNGEDIPSLIKALEAQLPAGAVPTSAQKGGSATLMGFESTMARSHPQLSAAVLKQGQETLKVYALVIEKLRQTGSPAALKKAAELERGVFDDIINKRLMAAEMTAAEKISGFKLPKDVSFQDVRKDVGNTIKDETVRALDDMRKYERLLWQEAEKDAFKTRKIKGEATVLPRAAKTNNLGEAFLDVATTMTPERFNAKMPAEIRSIMGRLGIDSNVISNYSQGKATRAYLDTGRVPEEYLTKPAGPRTQKRVSIFDNTTVQDLINIRSDLLAYARDSATSNPSFAAFYGKMADAALKDLDALGLPAYDRARSFSRMLNDTFSRTFASDVTQGTTYAGGRAVATAAGEKLPAEVLVQQAYAKGTDLTSRRMSQIENAVGSLRKVYDDAVKDFGPNSPQVRFLKPYADVSNDAVVSIQDAHKRYLMLLANDAIDVTTQRVDPAKLQKFVNQHQNALRRMGLYNDLENAITAENTLRVVLDPKSSFNKQLASQRAFADLVGEGVENPTRVLTQILNGKKPSADFARLADIAVKNKAKDAGASLDGLKATVMDYAFTKAGGIDNFNVRAFEDAIFKPLYLKGPSLYSMMRNKGMMSISEAKNIKSLINRMDQVEVAMKSPQLLNELLTGAGAVEELALRVLGSKLGKAFDSSSLIAASAGSKYLRDMFDKTPLLATRQILEQAVKDPVMMAQLLKKTGKLPEEQSYLLARLFNSSMINAGVNYATSDTRPTVNPQQPPYAAPVPPIRQRRLMPSAPPTMGVPGVTGNVPPMPDITKSPLPSPAKPAAGGTSREMLQRLFPFDSTIQ